jgi:hypothetical protein
MVEVIEMAGPSGPLSRLPQQRAWTEGLPGRREIYEGLAIRNSSLIAIRVGFIIDILE